MSTSGRKTRTYTTLDEYLTNSKENITRQENAQNILGPQKKNYSRLKKKHKSIKPQTEALTKLFPVQSYKRIKGAVFASNQDGELASGVWTELESIMLVVIQEILFLTDLPSEPANIVSLYQFIASSEYVSEIKLPVVKKEAVEIQGKMEEMVAKQQLMLAGLSPQTLETVNEVEMNSV